MKLLRHLPRFQEALRQMEVMAARETWSRDQIQAYQLERLNAVWRHASMHTPHYRQLRADLRLPERFASLDEYRERMPLLEKSTVAREPLRFLSQQASAGEWYRTSGSTGMPLSVYHSREAHRDMLRARYRLYAAWGHELFDRMVWLWNPQDTSTPGLRGDVKRALQPGIDWLRGRLRLSVNLLGREDLRNHLRQIAAFRPSALYGFSRALWLLALEAKASGFQCDTLKFVSLTGETTPQSVVAATAAGFGVPAIVEYGSVEAPCIANQWPDHTFRVREDLVLLETLPRAEGVFDLVLTVLTNPDFALLRYQIGDLTEAPVVYPPAGFGQLASVTGRKDDLVYTRSGRCLHPTVIDEMVEAEETVPIRRYQVHQHRDGSVRVVLEVSVPPSPAAVHQLEAQYSGFLEGHPVRVELAETIPQTAAGKHRVVTSDYRPAA